MTETHAIFRYEIDFVLDKFRRVIEWGYDSTVPIGFLKNGFDKNND